MIFRSLGFVLCVFWGLSLQAEMMSPSSLKDRRGESSGQDLSVLYDSVLSGEADQWNTYKEFSPDRRRYVGLFYFETKDIATGAFSVKGNFKGPKASYQKWFIQIKNFESGRFETVFINDTNFSWQWVEFSKNFQDLDRYRNRKGKVLIRLRSNNARDVANLDQLVIEFNEVMPQEPAPQEPAPQEPAPQEPAPQEPAPQEPAPQEPAPQEPAPQEPAPQEPAPQEPAPQEPAPQEPAPQEPAPQEPAPQEPAPQEPAPQEPAPQEPNGLVSFTPGMTFQWQLQGKIATSVNADVYDIDLEDNEHNGVIQTLKNQGRKVICYFSAGTYENWRSDAGSFPASSLGSNNGWPGEKWLDVRNSTVRTIMKKRMERAIAAGCDAIEPDNLDAYQNNSGFNLSAQDQIDFLHFLADTAHGLGISIGLKNTVDLIKTANLHKVFDWTLNEECYEYNECDTLLPFIAEGKAVFIAEYNDNFIEKCPDAKRKKFELVIFNLDLAGRKNLRCN